MDNKKISQVTAATGCGSHLAHDLLRLAGGDVDTVLSASAEEAGIESVKCAVIDKRIRRIEDVLAFGIKKGDEDV